jgi:hypothetical protein
MRLRKYLFIALLLPIIEALPMEKLKSNDELVISKLKINHGAVDVIFEAQNEDIAVAQAVVIAGLLDCDPVKSLPGISLVIRELQKVLPATDRFWEMIIAAILLRENVVQTTQLLDYFGQKHNITINNASPNLSATLRLISELAITQEPSNTLAIQFKQIIDRYTKPISPTN